MFILSFTSLLITPSLVASLSNAEFETGFENIYKGYALEKIYNNYSYKGEGIQAIDKQFFMHPYAGLRFEFEMTTRELCQRYIKP